MARLRSRASLRERAKRHAQRVSDVGNYSDAQWNRSIQEAWGKSWHEIIKTTRLGIGAQFSTVVVSTTVSDIDLPPNALSVLGFRRSSGGGVWANAQPTDFGAVIRNNWMVSPPPLPGVWFLIGPTSTTPQQIRVLPSLGAGDQYTLAFTEQEPSLGDPEDPNDDTITVDVLVEPVEDAICAIARVVATTREDGAEMQRALQALQLAVTSFEDAVAVRDQGPARGLMAYRQTNGWW